MLKSLTSKIQSKIAHGAALASTRDLTTRLISLLMAFAIATAPSLPAFAQAADVNVTAAQGEAAEPAEPEGAAFPHSHLGSLAAGQIVKIPHEYLQYDSGGRINVNRSLLIWTRAAEGRIQAETAGVAGDGKSDASPMFKVTLHNKDNGTVLPEDGSTTVFAKLSDLAVIQGNQGNEVYLKVLAPTAAFSPAVVSASSAPVTGTPWGYAMANPRPESPGRRLGYKSYLIRSSQASDSRMSGNANRHYQNVSPGSSFNMEAISGASYADCETCQARQLGPFQRLAQQMDSSNHLARVLASYNSRTRRNLMVFKETFEKTCHMNFDTFRAAMDAKLDGMRNNPRYQGRYVPSSSLMLAIFTHESGGDCGGNNRQDSGGGSFGLGQINLASSHASAAALHNPMVNLDESVRILQEKYDIIMRKFDFRYMTQKDADRMAMMVYKGASGVLERGRNNMIEYARANGLAAGPGQALDWNRYEDLRPFLLRNTMSESAQRATYGRAVYAGTIASQTTAVAYAENIVGYNPRGVVGGFGLDDYWASTRRVATVEQ